MNLVRRHKTIHVVQFKDGLIEELQDQCHAIISLGERMNVRLEKAIYSCRHESR